MNVQIHSQTNRLLGYPDDARLLIVNADDLGMCNSINEAIFGALKAGLVRSASLMVACPWAIKAINFLKAHPEIPFAVHLTAVCDADDYTWRPVASKERVPDLLDNMGCFRNKENFPDILDQSILAQLETEFRAQIEVVLSTGLKPTHLDWHSLRLDSRPELFDLMLGLAREYKTALRVTGKPMIREVQRMGLPCNDHDLMDSFTLDPAGKSARYVQMLHDLPVGLSEWAVHPGLDNTELLALEPDGNHVRQSDFDFWTSNLAQDAVTETGVILLDYRGQQDVWNRG